MSTPLLPPRRRRPHERNGRRLSAQDKGRRRARLWPALPAQRGSVTPGLSRFRVVFPGLARIRIQRKKPGDCVRIRRLCEIRTRDGTEIIPLPNYYPASRSSPG